MNYPSALPLHGFILHPQTSAHHFSHLPTLSLPLSVLLTPLLSSPLVLLLVSFHPDRLIAST